MKRLTILEEDNKLTILQKGVGMKAEYEFAKAMQDAWDTGWRLPEESKINMHNAFFRLYKGNVVGRCIMFKGVATPIKKEEVSAEQEEVVASAEQETKEKKAGRPSKNK